MSGVFALRAGGHLADMRGYQLDLHDFKCSDGNRKQCPYVHSCISTVYIPIHIYTYHYISLHIYTYLDKSIQYIYIHIYIYIYLSLSLYLYVSMSLSLSISLSLYLSVSLSLCLSISLSLYLSISPSIYLSICLSFFLSFYLYLYLYMYKHIHTCLLCKSTYLLIYLCIIHKPSKLPESKMSPWHFVTGLGNIITQILEPLIMAMPKACHVRI